MNSVLQRLSAWPKPPTDPPAMPSFQIRLVHARTESPDAERQLPRLDPHPLRLAVPGPAMAVHQVFALSLRIIRQAQFPQRQFEMRFLSVVWVEAHCHQDEVRQIRRTLAEVEDVVVPGQVRLEAKMGLQCSVLPADAIELGDLGDDVAG